MIAVGRDGTESDVRRLYVETADPAVDYFGTWNDWSPAGGVGVPGWLSFTDRSGGTMLDATVKYLWHVDDGPVQETPRAADVLTTDVVYTPESTGENILYVQREFTDGVRSPVSQFTLLFGTLPLVQSPEYPAGVARGGAGVAGTFHFSGGMPGIVAYDYRFVDGSGSEAAAGSVTADTTGAAEVTFAPATAGAWYRLTVTGHTANGTATDPTVYSFGTA